jgi:hypothetical protein
MGDREGRDWRTLRGIVRRRGRAAVAQKLLSMPNDPPKARDGVGRGDKDFEACYLMEYALSLLAAEGSDESCRAASKLVAEATGLSAEVIRRRHGQALRGLTKDERRRLLLLVEKP